MKTFEEEVREICNETAEMLIAKNKAYGNSALDPVRIFSQAATDEQLRVRLDDKLSRIARGQVDAFGEDPYGDARGYLVLLEIHRRRAAAQRAGALPGPPSSNLEAFAKRHGETEVPVLLPPHGRTLIADGWFRVHESLAVRRVFIGGTETLMPGEDGYAEVNLALLRRDGVKAPA